ncbi:MAG: nucleotidyltransferase domain-containing protein [Lentimicrobiaceae bacterium]|nr:nucleotidyltransferase domain-containing protein [Lentimicrobiaceae bacterium]
MNPQIFIEIQALKRKILPSKKVILFGSQAYSDARTDSDSDSDWDLLVLLNKEKKRFFEGSDKYWDTFSDISDKYGTSVSAKIYAKKDWKLRPSLLEYYVEQESIEVK